MKEEQKEKAYKLIVDNKQFEVKENIVTGASIKRLAGIPANYGVWLKKNGPEPDEEIDNDQSVDLSHPGIEKFFTGPKTTTEGEH